MSSKWLWNLMSKIVSSKKKELICLKDRLRNSKGIFKDLRLLSTHLKNHKKKLAIFFHTLLT